MGTAEFSTHAGYLAGDDFPLALFRTDEEGRCIYVNLKFCALCGVTAGQALQQYWFAFLCGDEHIRVKREWFAYFSGRQDFSIEFRFERAAGEAVHILTHVQPQRDAQGRVYGHVGTFTNINTYKQAEDLLRKQRDESHNILHHSIEGFFSNDRHGRIQDVNEAYAGMVGYSIDELKRMTIADLEFIESPAEIQAHIKKLLREGNERFESRHRHKNGQGVDVEVSVNFDPDMDVPIFAFVRDISQRKRVEEELRLQSEMINHMTEGVLLVNSEGFIVYANPRLEEMFGYAAGEMPGMPVASINAPTEVSPEETAQEIISALQKNGAWHGEIKNIKKDGSVFWCQAGVSVFEHIDFGTVFISVHSDITEKRKAVQAKERLEIQLNQARKMQAIGTMAGGIAHEFNNMLGIIIGSAELLGDDLPESGSMRRQIERILKAGRQAKELVKQILTFSRASSPKRVPTKLGALIEESLKFMHSSVPRTLETRCRLSARQDSILVDPDEIHQILMNLFANAIYATKGHGLIEIDLENTYIERKDSPHLENLPPGSYLLLSVRDNGGGMSEEVKARAFEPFFTTKEVGQGTGMGLALVYGIMRRYGGAIAIDNQTGKGTAFRLFFPLNEIETDI